MRPYIGDCRYNDCRHMTEPGCRIQAVADAGAIRLDRLESYRILLKELESAPEEWE
jgi:ribosome biogenesis GTPase